LFFPRFFTFIIIYFFSTPHNQIPLSTHTAFYIS
jgi:hypothetical protein